MCTPFASTTGMNDTNFLLILSFAFVFFFASLFVFVAELIRAWCGVFPFFFTCSYLFWFDLSLFFQRFCGITVDVKFSFLTIWFAQVTRTHKIQREQQQRRWRRQRRQQAASANFLWFLPWSFHTFQFTRVIGMFWANQVIKCDSVVFFGGSVTTTHSERTNELHKRNHIVICSRKPSTTTNTNNKISTEFPNEKR